MRKHLKYLGKCICFLLILILLLQITNFILLPKYYTDQDWPTTSTFIGFYQMQPDTIDVLTFGSSHMASGFNPQELYAEYGIRSYNLSCEQQNILVSYYWLVEALRTQQPKALILDCFFLFPYDDEMPFNSSESCLRKAVDYMKPTTAKRAMIRDICELDSTQSALSYYFPNIRFHTRWYGLNKSDFRFHVDGAASKLKGYCPFQTACETDNFNPFTADPSVPAESFHPVMENYLEKITQLCKENGIKLILVKTPTTAHNVARYNAIRAFADIHELDFYDFNESSVYHDSDFDFLNDMYDNGHCSISGAGKVTSYLGRVLSSECSVPSVADSQWENAMGYYNDTLRDYRLPEKTDILEYLEALNQDDYIIFLSAKEDIASGMNEEIMNALKKLGLQTDLTNKEEYSYYAVISPEKVVEECSVDPLTGIGSIPGLKPDLSYNITSNGSNRDGRSSIQVDGKEHSPNRGGLNIVVYNRDTGKFVDAVCFDTGSEEHTVKR